MKRLVFKSILAGGLIAIAGWVFLVCQGLDIGVWSKVIGAAMFSIGLIAVIVLQANLYTGKVGYINNKEKLISGLIILVVNLAVAFLIGFLYRICIGKCIVAMDARLMKTWYRFLVDSIGCGACIYFAVEGYKITKSFIPVILGVMAFILGGFEHCVADMFYYGAGELTLKGLGYIGLAIIGNSIGSLVVRFLQTNLFDTTQDNTSTGIV